jgi:anthranilate synthase component 1
MDTGITIRSLWVRNGKIYWQAGAGIVFDSDPEKEWQECQNKARAVKMAITSSANAGGTDDFAHRQL